MRLTPTASPPRAPGAREGGPGAPPIAEFAVGDRWCGPEAIAAGEDGALWFTCRGALGRITTSGDATVVALGGDPTDVAAGPDGALWATLPGAVARITLAGVVALLPAGPGAAADLTAIASAAGDEVWITSASPAALLRVGPEGERERHTAGLGRGSRPAAAVADGQGGVWFADGLTPARLLHADRDGWISGVGLGPGREPVAAVAADPQGGVWYVHGDVIGRLDPDGDGQETWRGLTPGGRPAGIAAAPGGGVWFTSPGAGGRIGRIDARGDVEETRAGLTPDGGPHGIAIGPDGAAWFTLRTAGRVGRIADRGSAGPVAPGEQGGLVARGVDG
ncbi:MAG: hypothetical protein AB7V62_05020 [Thermoleophilia bacterium]